MEIEYIIVQAGGKGTRLEELTTNKPKALVPIENLPMLFHLFKKFPDKRFIIIADYKKDVLREYLNCFAMVKYQVVEAYGTGTCSGIKQAISLLPGDKAFMLIWCDLILTDSFRLPSIEDNYIGISQTFPCRWSYRNGVFEEECSEKHGVAGLFLFKDKTQLDLIPESGELVRWMKERNMFFSEISLAGTREFGLMSEYKAIGKEKCRPFNKITVSGDTLIKEAIDEQGKRLAFYEGKWYDFAISAGFDMIPKIYDVNPIKMERIDGKNIYEYDLISFEAKREILRELTDAIKSLHNLKRVPTDIFSLKEAYYEKTMNRLSKVRDLIPFADQRTIIVNGRECRNIYYYKREMERKIERLSCDNFAFIHGDCTFSNMMLRNDTKPVLIDPRGYFGHTELYGDPNYDWAKLYYSIVGNYDRFNLKDFRLIIDKNGVSLEVESNQWENLEREFFFLSEADPQIIKLLHAVIWLSLTTYTWQDYDSICGAFYNGIFYLEEVL